jgi:hypothetical protein
VGMLYRATIWHLILAGRRQQRAKRLLQNGSYQG